SIQRDGCNDGWTLEHEARTCLSNSSRLFHEARFREECRSRSGWIRLFRASGRQLTDCGVSHLLTSEGEETCWGSLPTRVGSEGNRRTRAGARSGPPG